MATAKMFQIKSVFKMTPLAAAMVPALLTTAMQASAQDDAKLEEVLVTATRRAETDIQ